jgi:hypothetical protein
MKKTAYGKPLLLTKEGKKVELDRVDAESEIAIQKLIFEHPDCLPISDIDESFNPLVPVCMELGTSVGPLDILMVTPNGEIAIVETKLWRNPEARRKVVAQILDYAKELSNWSYEDLQREVNKKLGHKGNTLYRIAKEMHPGLITGESDFVDSVSRNLARGRFLLLIAGDGIREGAIGIGEFLSNASHLNFSFAMVELNVYEGEGTGTLIVPKTIVKTVELPKLIIEIPEGLKISKDEDYEPLMAGQEQESSPQKKKEKQFYIDFWKEFVEELSFDDPGQPIPNPGKAQNLYVYPGRSKKAWISAYFAQSYNRVGVYFRTQNDHEGNEIASFLNDFEEDIKNEFDERVIWQWDQNCSVSARMPCKDVFNPSNRQQIKDFFHLRINEFVNVFRPKLKKFHT